MQCDYCQEESSPTNDVELICGGCNDRNYCSIQCYRDDWKNGGHILVCGNRSHSHNSNFSMFLINLFDGIFTDLDNKDQALKDLQSLLAKNAPGFSIPSSVNLQQIIYGLFNGYLLILGGEGKLLSKSVCALWNFFERMGQHYGVNTTQLCNDLNPLLIALSNMDYPNIASILERDGEIIDKKILGIEQAVIAHGKESNALRSFREGFKNLVFAHNLRDSNSHRPSIPTKIIEITTNDLEQHVHETNADPEKVEVSKEKVLDVKSDKHKSAEAVETQGLKLDTSHPTSMGPLRQVIHDLERKDSSVAYEDPITKERKTEKIEFETTNNAFLWFASSEHLFFVRDSDKEIIRYDLNDLANFQKLLNVEMIGWKSPITKKGLKRFTANATGKGGKLTQKKMDNRAAVTKQLGNSNLLYFPGNDGIFVPIEKESFADFQKHYKPILKDVGSSEWNSFEKVVKKDRSKTHKRITKGDRRLAGGFTEADFKSKKLVLVERANIPLFHSSVVTKSKTKKATNPFKKGTRYFDVFEAGNFSQKNVSFQPAAASSSSSSSSNEESSDSEAEAETESDPILAEYNRLNDLTMDKSLSVSARTDASKKLLEYHSQHAEKLTSLGVK